MHQTVLQWMTMQINDAKYFVQTLVLTTSVTKTKCQWYSANDVKLIVPSNTHEHFIKVFETKSSTGENSYDMNWTHYINKKLKDLYVLAYNITYVIKIFT